jgi:uncharacterized protein YfaS (alpha-2-macroglobulin family)
MLLDNAPVVLGSKHLWTRELTLNGAVWDLSAKAVTLWWKKPSGETISAPADSADAAGLVSYNDTVGVLDQLGHWSLSFEVSGYGKTYGIPFSVVASP